MSGGLAERLADVRRRIAEADSRARTRAGAGAAPASAEPPILIAVSKTQPIDRIAELYALGQRDFGENYAQELLTKAAEAERLGLDAIRWHFIGHLQTNKVKALLPVAYAVHSADSERLVRELARRRAALAPARPPLPIFLEVNISADPGKSGVPAGDVPALAAAAAAEPSLRLEGLMCIPAAELAGPALRGEFARMRELRDRCGSLTRGGLSMGMSGDFEIAIEEGATHVRVGTSLFGARAARTG